MKLRHAAALALVGWYLMIPPGAQSGFDTTAPLGKWFVYGGYDSAHECEGAKFLDREGLKQRNDPLADAFKHAQCIATDDPRLKSR
jgi:hypothetical protein